MTNIKKQSDRINYGRIFVENEEDIDALYNIILNLDNPEYHDLPRDVITVYSEENYKSVYAHNFCKMDVTKILLESWKNDVHCFIVCGKVGRE